MLTTKASRKTSEIDRQNRVVQQQAVKAEKKNREETSASLKSVQT